MHSTQNDPSKHMRIAGMPACPHKAFAHVSNHCGSLFSHQACGKRFGHFSLFSPLSISIRCCALTMFAQGGLQYFWFFKILRGASVAQKVAFSAVANLFPVVQSFFPLWWLHSDEGCSTQKGFRVLGFGHHKAWITFEVQPRTLNA